MFGYCKALKMRINRPIFKAESQKWPHQPGQGQTGLGDHKSMPKTMEA